MLREGLSTFRLYTFAQGCNSSADLGIKPVTCKPAQFPNQHTAAVVSVFTNWFLGSGVWIIDKLQIGKPFFPTKPCSLRYYVSLKVTPVPLLKICTNPWLAGGEKRGLRMLVHHASECCHFIRWIHLRHAQCVRVIAIWQQWWGSVRLSKINFPRVYVGPEDEKCSKRLSNSHTEIKQTKRKL